MSDSTESIRRHMIETGQPQRDLEVAQQRWGTDAVQEEFEVIGFAAPFVVVKRKADGVKGTLEFTHSPRVYFNFVPDQPKAPSVGPYNPGGSKRGPESLGMAARSRLGRR